MSMPVNIDEYQTYLSMDEKELVDQHINALVIARVKRIRALYAFWLQFPNMFSKDIVQHDISLFEVAKSEAYDDVRLVEIILGNLQSASKDFMRWKVTSMLIEDRNAARRDRDWRAAVAADDKLGKYHKLDKDDTPDMAFDKIVPQMLEPSDDPSVIGLHRIPNLREKIRKMEKKYLQQSIEDAEYEEVETNDEVKLKQDDKAILE